MIVTTIEQIPGKSIELGGPLVVSVVRAANVVSDIRENIRNLVGGRMGHYEKLLQQATEEAIETLKAKAEENGYDGVIGMRIAHPTVVEGGVELIVYGSGFRWS
ncbi:MAG: hypothetical protein CL920_22070 [Deltaproteobacteria bacterium]|nr:hypothetical protein [Deltaproteobacteria bacterium]MBU51385.1 hypothetical protein [Deltaproteobacteria bacterium]|tara:strand:+ start:7054 stop:7365 length:312 start_codon:yes stop_codon:yes gene_type:complete